MARAKATGEKTAKAELYCSFCNKPSSEVAKLIAGPSAFICAECIDLCLDIIIEETADENEVVVRIHGPGEVSSELEFIFVNFIAQGLAFIKKDYRVGVRSVRTISKMV